MNRYTARMVHTEETIKTLIRYQDRQCHPVINYIGGAGCVILVILSLVLQPYIGKVSTGIFSFLGCVLFVTNRHRPGQQFDEFMERLNGKKLAFRYSFGESYVLVERDSRQEKIPYDQITALAESGRYCFWVYKNKTAFMFAKDSAEDYEKLKDFLQQKTNKKWINAAKKFKIRIL